MSEATLWTAAQVLATVAIGYCGAVIRDEVKRGIKRRQLWRLLSKG